MATTTERRDGGVDAQAGDQAAAVPVQASAQARGCPAPVMPRPRRLSGAEREVLRAARVYSARLDADWTATATLRRAIGDLAVAASQVTP